MKHLRIAALSVLSLAAAATVAIAQPAPAPAAAPASPSWPSEPRWHGPGPMPRHYLTTTWGIPAPYATMTNPLPDSAATRRKGKALYAKNCAACHGDHGAGDGPRGATLKPSPGNLVWLSDIPRKQWDAFMYWSTAEGGSQIGSAMPAFKGVLSRDEIWAVTAYIQANLPFVSQF